MSIKTFRWVLVFGLVVRLVLMPISVHPDFWALFFSGNLLPAEGVTNIYNYLGEMTPDNNLYRNYGTNFFTYPPLTYFTFGFFLGFSAYFFKLALMKRFSLIMPISTAMWR